MSDIDAILNNKLKINEEAILVGMNTNELVVKIRPEKNSSRTINDAVELYCHKHIKVVVKQLSRPIEIR